MLWSHKKNQSDYRYSEMFNHNSNKNFLAFFLRTIVN